MDLPDALERDIGPFPVWGWLAILGGGIGLAVVIRRSDLFGGPGNVEPVDSTADQPDPAASGDVYAPGVTGGTSSGYFGGSGGGGGTVPIPTQTNPATSPAIQTNQAWQNAAIAWATAHGISGVTAARVTGNYLSGDTLSASEAGVLQQIIGALGPAPEGAPSPVVETAPPPVINPPPTSTYIPPITVPPVVDNTGGVTAPPNQGGGTNGWGAAYIGFHWDGSDDPGYPGYPFKLTNPRMRDDAIRIWQRRMELRGYGTGGVDGVFGPQSQAAARALQSDSGLSVDGIVGPDTWRMTWIGAGYGPNSTVPGQH